MKKRNICLPIIFVCLTNMPAIADTLYDNVTSTSFTSNLYLINGTGYFDGSPTTYTIADSFTLSSTATITGATVGLETLIGDSPQSLGFVISSAPFGGTVYESGAQGLTPTSEGSLFFGIPSTQFATWDSSLSFTPLTLGPGTYYLQLENGSTANGNLMWWDQSNGPSSASYLYGSGFGPANGLNSETFTILGSSNSSATPEPSSLVLLGTGILGLAGMVRRRITGERDVAVGIEVVTLDHEIDGIGLSAINASSYWHSTDHRADENYERKLWGLPYAKTVLMS